MIFKQYKNKKTGEEILAVERESDFAISFEVRWISPNDKYVMVDLYACRIIDKTSFNQQYEPVL